MPTDLSKIGLEGLESFSNRQYQDAMSQGIQSRVRTEDFALEQAQKMQELSDRAAAALQDVALGRSNGMQVDTSEPQSLAEPLELAADIYMRGGATEKGAEFLEKASEIRKRESDIGNDEVLARQRRLENIVKGGDIVARKLGGAKNADEWAQGMREVEAEGLIEPHLMAQLKEQPFHPDVAAYFREQGISAAAQAQLDMQANNLDQRERQNAIGNAFRNKTVEIAERRAKDSERRTAIAEKNGGDKASSAAAPTANELASATAALNNGPFKGATFDQTEMKAAAQTVASRAKQLVRENKALDWDTAMQQAIIQTQAEGSFKLTAESKLHKLTGGLLGDEPKMEFKKKQPLAMPSKKSELVKGQVYITSKGMAKWNGSAFESVAE